MLTLKNVVINKYKCFLTEQSVRIEDGVTRIVGKNESGKTALLEALSKFNYFIDSDARFVFDKTKDYPRNELKTYEQLNPQNDHVVISCIFEIDEQLSKQINLDLGVNTFRQKTIIINKQYNGMLFPDVIEVDCKAFIQHFLDQYTIISDKRSGLDDCENLSELNKRLMSDTELKAISEKLSLYISTGMKKWNRDELSGYIWNKHILPNIPKFWYFDEYYSLPPQISLNKYCGKEYDATFTEEQFDIASVLFSMAGINVQKLVKDDNHEVFIAELEATSNSITDKFLEFWSTNTNLEIIFDIQTTGHDKLLNIRIKNTKHRVTLPLKNRSKGFVWFFSFLVWFSKIEGRSNIIMLLDEPGLNLHADAQNDLLRFIDTILAPNYQVVYSTHSPFMIDPTKLHEVRTVYDSNDAKTGSIISDAIEEKDRATLFPLQAALGYDIAQNLYISSKNLLVEGVADLVYISIISDQLRKRGKESLNDDITIVPVGGLDKVATFISLLRGNKLKIVCLLDTFIDQKGKARMNDLIRDKIIKENNVLFFDMYTQGIYPSEIEDVFEKSEYIELFCNEFSEYSKNIFENISKSHPIVQQINRIIEKERYNHYRPANYLSKHPEIIERLSDNTLNRFSQIFSDINRLLM